MADWCVGTGQTPATYLTLTRLERDAFVTAANNLRK